MGYSNTCSRTPQCAFNFADVAELVDALDLGSSDADRGGSSPFVRTKIGETHRRFVLDAILQNCRRYTR